MRLVGLKDGLQAGRVLILPRCAAEATRILAARAGLAAPLPFWHLRRLHGPTGTPLNAPTCGNCDSPLFGRYCAQCGQHAHDSARSLGALLHDGWHVVTHLDGRFWSTMHLLLLRPGQLTREYFAERRARYVPPVRLYLVLSLLVFALASLTAHVQSSTLRPGGPSTPNHAVDLDLRQMGITPKDCSKVMSSWPWLQQALRASCERNVESGGKEVLHAARANLPRMMFVFLPLMAAVMLLLYWFPRRFYVEHLVFFLHNHAALFLAMTLPMLLSLLAGAVPALARLETASVAVVALYAPWYVYRSMRVVYGQGRLLTLLKIAFVSLAYVTFLMITLLLTLIVSVLTT
jgi:hypothetical protein